MIVDLVNTVIERGDGLLPEFAEEKTLNVNLKISVAYLRQFHG